MRSALGASTIGVFVAAALAGCAGAGPDLFPPTPLSNQTAPDGTVEFGFDSAGDGTVDYRERLAPNGQVVALRFDLDRDGTYELEVPWGPGPVGDDGVRHLIVMLDSIPHNVVRDMWEQGRFRMFHPPSRTISPFPVLTDLSFSEFLGVSPCPGCEAEHFDGKKQTSGLWTYADEGNSPWTVYTDYHLNHVAHSAAYLWPDKWYLHELGKIQRGFHSVDKKLYNGYVLTTSPIGHHYGRDGHLAAMIVMDRLCRSIVHKTRGKVHITLLSDHGHNLMRGKMLDLLAALERSGYRWSKTLDGPRDIVVPTWGIVTCVTLHTQVPAALARDAVLADGVNLAMYKAASGDVVVLGKDGRARIRKSDSGYRYIVERGDPLELLPTWAALAMRGQVRPDGFVADRALFEATHSHKYPDAVHRIWRAFNGLVVHTPDVMLSLQDGTLFGDKFMDSLVECRAAHGNLDLQGSCGFVMTTAGKLPDVMRMEDLHGALTKAGVPLAPKPAEKP